MSGRQISRKRRSWSKNDMVTSGIVLRLPDSLFGGQEKILVIENKQMAFANTGKVNRTVE